MPAGNTVRPQKWTQVIDLYDDGEYSAIWGYFDNGETKRLGVRWNGEDNHVGYPSQGSNSLWYAEPEFLVQPILFALLKRVLTENDLDADKYVKNINIAISESCQTSNNNT